MSIRIKDPVDGVIRLIEEQVTKNSLDVNNIRKEDIVFNERLSRIEAGSNLGGANLVRFAFKKNGGEFYRVNTFIVNMPSDWVNGNFIEFHTEDSNDIPAYGYIKDGVIIIDFNGDYNTNITSVLGINSNTGTSKIIAILSTTTFGGTSLTDLNPNINKSQIVNILNDVNRGNNSTQYVSFDINNDSIWSWVYIGTRGTNGINGTSIFSVVNDVELETILLSMHIGDIFIAGTANITGFNIGDISKLESTNPATWSNRGNIIGPIGPIGPKGNIGISSLITMTILNKTTDPETFYLERLDFNRTPIVGDTTIAVWNNNTTNKSYICLCVIISILEQVVILNINEFIETTGKIGPASTIPGPAGQDLQIMDGIFTPLTLPLFSSTVEGQAYIVIDTTVTPSSYDLYIHGFNGNDWTIINDWGGVAGPAPFLSTTSTTLNSGSNAYANISTISSGNYNIEFGIPRGVNGVSPDIVDNITSSSTFEALSANMGRYLHTLDIFDILVRTQVDFDALIASPTWLNAESVVFVGQFTKNISTGIKIPQTVKIIQGFNGAKITVTGFNYNVNTARAGLWYAEMPTTTDYSISNLTVNCNYGFNGCTQLTNCTGTGTGNGAGYGFNGCTQLTNCIGTTGAGFYSCTQLTNCTGIGTNANKDSGYGFYDCTQLTNCIGSGTAYGFYDCTQLTNCIGKGTSYYAGVGFLRCTQLINCTGTGIGTTGDGYGFNGCTQLTNCTGTGTSTTGGYGFYSCSWVNGCKQGTTASTTAFTFGNMLHVDTATVVSS